VKAIEQVKAIRHGLIIPDCFILILLVVKNAQDCASKHIVLISNLVTGEGVKKRLSAASSDKAHSRACTYRNIYSEMIDLLEQQAQKMRNARRI
jgi:hypothetical protein